MKRYRMKNVFGLLVLLLAIAACKPEQYQLGNIISKEDLKYSITQNSADPNEIFLESMTDGANPLWITPMGRSTRVQDTVRLPFAGEYMFVYGATSAGGFVQADTFKLTLTTNNLSYVDDPLWTMLSGGVDNEKEWLLDLDENGVSKFFAGPLYFYGTEDSWESVALLATGMGRDEVNATLGISDGWNWNPDWPGNTWLMDAGDYGSMTFSLKGNAIYSAEHKMLARTDNGTYFLDADGKKLSITDGSPLHDSNRDGHVVKWGDLKLMSLTENTMQLAALRDETLSGEGPCLLVYNYISREYSDNWVPEDLPDPEPELPEGWEEDISQTVNTTIQWKLSDQNPLDWANLDGSMMNGWQTPADYPDWLGTPDPSVYGGFSMTLNSADGSVEFVTPDGTTSNGTYSIDEKGIYSFDITVPTFQLIGWANFGPDANNQLRILQIEKDLSGNVTGMWLGAKDAVKPEYMAYHLIPQAAGGGGGEPEGTELAFDATKILVGDLENNGNFRFEIYNEYGSGTKDNPPLDPASVVFENRLEVTFTLSGIAFNEGTAGSYLCGIQYANSDWSVQYWTDSWSDGSGSGGEVMVTGDGTYTVTFDPGASVSNALVFVVDMLGMGADITDIEAVTATIDKVVVY